MENDKQKRRRAKKPRQEWNPHWSLKLLYTVASVALSLTKIAVCAAATVVLIVLVCGVVLMGTLGDYLQNDILPQAQNWSIDDYSVEETSFLYYVDRGRKYSAAPADLYNDRPPVGLSGGYSSGPH